MSPEEIVATISHSAFPSVVTEGDGDVVVLRRLEEEFADVGLTLIAAGGKDIVLKVFDRRHLLSKKKVIFVADRDLWVLTGIPRQYISDQLLFTKGYSIENDMFVDGLQNLLMTSERIGFNADLKVVCHWFALAASRHIDEHGNLKDEAEERLSIHPRELFEDEDHAKKLVQLLPSETYPDELYDRVHGSFGELLRGKTLFELLVMHSTHKYSYDALLNMAASQRGPLLRSIFEQVGRHFGLRSA